ncbi:hypothetical protein GCM10028778_18290 [Barrientosiimonas marina]|uniref:DUF948 domain-containing protein n=1 Tax=Lentibacillus kimchii TaxID=1542911 RepID=A0ABW2UVP5_9BACI
MWVGIGVIIIGVVLLGLVALLIKPLQSLTHVLSNLEKTTEELPGQVGDVIEGTKGTIHSANGAISELNEQLSKLGHVFQFINRIVSSLESLLAESTAINNEMKAKTDNPLMSRYHLEDLYGALALGYAVLQRRK